MAAAGNSGGATSSAAPWLVTAAAVITTDPTSMPGWMAPLVPTRMTVRMPAWCSSFTTMLIDGAPMPLVAHTTGEPPGSRARKLSSPRLRASTRLSARCRSAISSLRPGSPESKAMLALRQVGRSEADVVQATGGHGIGA